LEKKKIRPSLIEKKDTTKESRDSIVDALCEGVLTIAEDGTITQKLNFPVGQVEELKYSLRMTAAEMDAMNRFKDENGKSRAMIAKLTKQMVAIIDKLDTTDLALSQTIASFYYLV
jgi:hypothetical protein